MKKENLKAGKSNFRNRLGMRSHRTIRLCIFTIIRTTDFSNVPGNVLKEASNFGNLCDRVLLIHFHKKHTRRLLNRRTEVITLPYLEPSSPLRFFLFILTSYLFSFPLLLKIALLREINLVRADDLLITGLPCVIVAKLLGLKCIVSMHGDIEEIVKFKMGSSSKWILLASKIIRSVSKYVLSNSDACIIVNRALEKKAKQLGSKRTFLTHPNIDLSLFKPTHSALSRNFTVLFVGRLEPEKGPINVVLVAELMTDVDFVIVGYGSLYIRLQNIIKEKKLKNVRLVGKVSQQDLPKFYNIADVVLLPSYSEGLPIVMLEAMASEVPVIVSNVGDVRDILEGGNGGFIVKPGNIQDIVQMIHLLSDKDLKLKIGKAGRLNVLNNFSNFVKNQMEFYTSVVQSG